MGESFSGHRLDCKERGVMFSQNEKVVYSGHGVAQITRILEKTIAGSKVRFFELKFISKDMTILVPVESAVAAGMRSLSSKEQIDNLFKMMIEPIQPVSSENGIINWNKRNKEYQIKIRTGDISEIGEIYRDLNRSERVKELSFGEKDLLHKTELFLIEEISLVKRMTPKDVENKLRLSVNRTVQKTSRPKTQTL